VAPTDAVRFGFTLDDLDRLARVAVQVNWTMAGDVHERYCAAWSAIAEELFSAVEPPSERVLIGAGQQAIRDEVRSMHRTHGLPLDGGDGNTYGVAAFWWLQTLPTPSPERAIVEREALATVLPLISAQDREALLMVAACDGDRERAALALQVHPRTVLKRLRSARRVVFAAWHEGETPRPVWREARRLPEDKLVPCGTPSAYHRHRRRGEPTCEPCRRALDQARKDRAARRAA
jgi:hypothetical protein